MCQSQTIVHKCFTFVSFYRLLSILIYQNAGFLWGTGVAASNKAGEPVCKTMTSDTRPVRVLLLAILLLAAIVCSSTIGETVIGMIRNTRAVSLQAELSSTRVILSLISEAEAALYGLVLTGQPEFTMALNRATEVLGDREAALMHRPTMSPNSAGEAGLASILSDLPALQQAWTNAADVANDHRLTDALKALQAAHAFERSARMRGALIRELNRQSSAAARQSERTDIWLLVLRSASTLGMVMTVTVMLLVGRRIGRSIEAGRAATIRVEQLFEMGDMLQSAVDIQDIYEVLRAAALRLLPDLSGALYVFNNSHDRLDLAVQWGVRATELVDHMAPSACWALKRGKAHLNDTATGMLRCLHCGGDWTTLDIPMTARGQLFGMLQIAAVGPAAAARLEEARPVAEAVGDAMSLALSNAALRDQLRNQALRDGLTTLYNRRFLEEVLVRLCVESEQRRSSIAMIMLDLDHFKKLNDTHGHTMGDTVLREVAAAILTSLRATDVACRYGGEELVILLPDCPLEIAIGKAEQIRSRITNLSFETGVTVTASLGVGALPDTSNSAQSLLASADAALYRAKTMGRNRVIVAPFSSSAPGPCEDQLLSCTA